MRICVIGEPAPQGSKTAVRRGARIVQLEGSSTTGRDKHAAWRRAVLHAASAVGNPHPFDGPVDVEIEFRMPRGRTVRRALPAVKPDLDKLIRSTLDGLVAAGVIVDDSLVVDVAASKVYADLGAPGADITIRQAGAA